MFSFLETKIAALLVVLRLGEGDMAITHLQFANDMILFSTSNMDKNVLFKRILKSFEFSSGLRINLSKSRMVGVGCSEEIIRPLAAYFSCKVGKLPLSYLGMPVGADSQVHSSLEPNH